MAGNVVLSTVIVFLLAASCSAPEKGKQAGEPSAAPSPLVILKPSPKVLTPEQKAELGFPEEVIVQAEAAADSRAEPFFEEVLIRSANLRGDAMLSRDRLSGFSVRTTRAEEVIAELSAMLRSRGLLIFKSEQNFGTVPDVVTVIRGNNSYDILKVQKTEAPDYHLDNKAVIAWLREQQKAGSFVVTGAGADWVEARFIKPPRSMKTFARRVAAFAPDVLTENASSVDKLAERMKRANGFYLRWD